MIKIFIVDGHILFRAGLSAILSMQPDFEIAGQAGTARDAIEFVPALRPDIVLMDISLPDGSGAEAAHAILAKYPQCKIILMFLIEHAAGLLTVIHSGAKGFISKNILPSKLIDAIRTVAQGEIALSPSMTMGLMEENPLLNPA